MVNEINYGILKKYIEVKNEYLNKNSLKINNEYDLKMREIVTSIELLRNLKKQNQIDTKIINEFNKQLPDMIYNLNQYPTKQRTLKKTISKNKPVEKNLLSLIFEKEINLN